MGLILDCPFCSTDLLIHPKVIATGFSLFGSYFSTIQSEKFRYNIRVNVEFSFPEGSQPYTSCCLMFENSHFIWNVQHWPHWAKATSPIGQPHHFWEAFLSPLSPHQDCLPGTPLGGVDLSQGFLTCFQFLPLSPLPIHSTSVFIFVSTLNMNSLKYMSLVSPVPSRQQGPRRGHSKYSC